MSVPRGSITVDTASCAPTQKAHFAATRRRSAAPVSFRTLSAAVLVSKKKICSKGKIRLDLLKYIFFLLDRNECMAFINPCPLGQTCVNTMGSYTCRRNTVTCGRGYHLTEDGTRCEGRRCKPRASPQVFFHLLHLLPRLCL